MSYKAMEKEMMAARPKEQVTSSRPIHFLIFCVRYLPRFLVRLGVLLTSGVYYVFCTRARRECKSYQKQVIEYTGGKAICRPRILRQITSFALCVTEKVEGWLGKMHYADVTFHDDDASQLKSALSNGRGALLIFSHLGNTEVLRSIAIIESTGADRYVPITIIMDKRTTDKFNRAIDNMNKNIKTDIIDVTKIEPDTIVLLMNRLDEGGMVVVAGDRTPEDSRHKLLIHKFLGQAAQFPYGTFLLPALLRADTYFFFALRKQDFMWHSKYDMFVHKATVTFDDCPRYEREARINALCGEFVWLLEGYCLEHPFQWYNFYDFWGNKLLARPRQGT